MRRLLARGAVALIALLLSACGGDRPTTPNGGGFAIAGTWRITTSGLATFARSCTLPALTATFTGGNASATGTLTVGGGQQMICTVTGGGTEVNPLPGQITFNTVRVNGNNVVFSSPGAPGSGNGGWTFNGTVGTNNVVSGTIAFREPVNGTFSTTSGAFSATRQ